MEVFINKREVGELLGLDGRTAVLRFKLLADALLLNRGKKIPLYSASKIADLSLTQKQTAYSVNKKSNL
jgi:hypothetical protein